MFGLLFEHGTRYEYLAVSTADESRNRVHVTGRCTPSILPSAPTTIAGRWGLPIVKHGRGRMTVDPRIPTMPGPSTSGVHRPARHRT